MKQSDVKVGDHFGYLYAFQEWAEVVVIDPPKRGKVNVTLIHPDPKVDDRQIEVPTKDLVPWGPGFAATEDAATRWAWVRQQNRIADGLTRLGVPRAREGFLGIRNTEGNRTSGDSSITEFDPEEIERLLRQAEKAKAPKVELPWAWMLAKLDGPWTPGTAIVMGGVYATEHQADVRRKVLADGGTEMAKLRVLP
jgi:hypothetical protein